MEDTGIKEEEFTEEGTTDEEGVTEEEGTTNEEGTTDEEETRDAEESTEDKESGLERKYDSSTRTVSSCVVTDRNCFARSSSCQTANIHEAKSFSPLLTRT